jgi:mRNA interferase RelE/StbE
VRAEFKASFLKDISKIKNKNSLKRIREIIETLEKAEGLQDVSKLKKLKGSDNYYRIKFGEYRIGLFVQDDLVVFIRCLHRKDIYRYFP